MTDAWRGGLYRQSKTSLTPSLPKPVNSPDGKAHTYTPANSIFDGPVTHFLSILCILVEVLSGAHSKGEKSLNDLKFDTFIGRFPSDGAASMTVKGLSITAALTPTGSSLVFFLRSSAHTCRQRGHGTQKGNADS